jgi:hypothetical protein
MENEWTEEMNTEVSENTENTEENLPENEGAENETLEEQNETPQKGPKAIKIRSGKAGKKVKPVKVASKKARPVKVAAKTPVRKIATARSKALLNMAKQRQKQFTR